MSNEAEQPVSSSDEDAASVGERIAAAAAAAADAGPVNEGGRLRRPSSLRSSAASDESVPSDDSSASDASGEDPGPKLTMPSFPRKLTPPPLPGKLTAPPFLRRGSKPEAEPHSTDAVVADDGPPQETGPSPGQKLVTLVSERPEVGLGIAFAAGLVIATILKRLAR